MLELWNFDSPCPSPMALLDLIAENTASSHSRLHATPDLPRNWGTAALQGSDDLDSFLQLASDSQLPLGH